MKPPAGLPLADKYGGIVFDDEGCVLLREPCNHYDGYVWTFAKGDPEPGETPAETALREVREETGVVARIVRPIQKVFRGGSGSVAYYLMAPVSVAPIAARFRKETSSVTWLSPRAARVRLGKNPNAVGRKRDLAVLAAACRLRRTGH